MFVLLKAVEIYKCNFILQSKYGLGIYLAKVCASLRNYLCIYKNH